MTQSLIRDLLIILAAGLFAGLASRWLRTSVLIGYLVVGAILGQGVLGWVRDEGHQLEQFAEVGVFLLLFSIGLEFSLDDLRRLARVLFIGGATQMLLVAVPVAVVLTWLDVSWQAVVLIAAAASFSSTVLVFKALSEWGQAEKRHGRHAIAILLFQDAALVPLLLVVPMLTGQGQATGVSTYFVLAATSVLFVVAVLVTRYLLSTWMIPVLAGYRSPELVTLFTLVCLGGVTFAAYTVGLPPAVGAFAAGLILNGNRWTKQIDALALPFRETFAAIFFIGLGLILDPRLIWAEPQWIFGSLIGLIIVKAGAAMIAFKLSGLTLRQSFGMGIGLAHVGEFAFVLALLGYESEVLSRLEYQRLVAIAVLSLILTPLLMKWGLDLIQDDESSSEQPSESRSPGLANRRASVIGAGPIGRQVASQLEISGKDVCMVDLSPINLHPFAQEGFRTVAGDATQPQTLQHAGVPESSLIVVSVPSDDIAIEVVRAIRAINPSAVLLVRCRYVANAPKIRSAGADQVVSEEAEASMALLRILNVRNQHSPAIVD